MNTASVKIKKLILNKYWLISATKTIACRAGGVVNCPEKQKQY